MSTAWYYDYYEKGVFPHQQELCEAVEWQCNLEGRRVVPTTNVQISSNGAEKEYESIALTDNGAEMEYESIALTETPINALTLRLRGLQKALNQLEEEINHINAEIAKTTNEQIDKSKFSIMSVTYHAQDSSLETGGAPIEEINLPGNKTIRFYYDKVYFNLYDFFTNHGSVQDRLAYEINLLYELGDWVEERIDWNKLSNPKNRFLCCLSNKDKNLAEFIHTQATNFKNIPTYRNRLIHDSIIHTNIETVGFPYKFHVFLPQDPNKQDTPRDEDAIKLCKKAKADVLKLLDGSYELILQHLRNYGKPPW